MNKDNIFENSGKITMCSTYMSMFINIVDIILESAEKLNDYLKKINNIFMVFVIILIIIWFLMLEFLKNGMKNYLGI